MKTYHKPNHKAPLMDRRRSNVDWIKCPACGRETDAWVYSPEGNKILCTQCARPQEQLPVGAKAAFARIKERLAERHLAERIDRDATKRGVHADRAHIVTQDGERMKYERTRTLARLKGTIETTQDKRTERVTLTDGSSVFVRLRDGQIIGSGPTSPVQVPGQRRIIPADPTGPANMDWRANPTPPLNRSVAVIDTTRRQENIADALDMVQGLMAQGVRAPHILARVAQRLEQQGRAMAEWKGLSK